MLFSLPRIASTLLLGITTFSLLSLYSTGYGLPESKVTFIISGGYLAIAFSQFFFGWISDVTYTEKFGARKPYIFLLAPLLVVSFLFLLMPGLVLKDPSAETLLLWLAIWNTLFEVCYAVTTPYQAWMAEQFQAEDRAKCSQIQNIFNYIGLVIQNIFTLVVLTQFTQNLETNPGEIPLPFLWICIGFGALFIGSFYYSAIRMPKEAKPADKPDMLNNFKNIFKNKNYLLVVLMQGMANMAWVMIGTVMLKYIEDVLQLSTPQLIIISACMIIGMVGFLSMWKKIIKRLGKTKSVTLIFLCGAIFLPTSLVGGIPMINTFFFAAIFILGLGAIISGWYLIKYILFADLAEDDYRRTNKMKAGIYVGFPSIALNLFQALGTFILGWLFTQ